MATSNLFVSPDQGWVLAASGPIGFARISVGHKSASWFVALASSTPAQNVIGQSIVGKDFWVNTNITDNIYIRAGNGTELSTGSGVSGIGALGLRFDIVTGPTNSSGGGGGGAATIADGADVAEGATTATAYSDTTGAAAGTVVGLLKGLFVGLKGLLTVVGNVASNATDSGNPVKVGGKFNATTPQILDGQRSDLQVTTRGSLINVTDSVSVSLADGTSNAQLIPLTQSGGGLSNRVLPFVFNGSSWDRSKKPSAVARLISAAGTVNNTLVKSSAGDVFQIRGYCNTGTARFLKLYNKATAPVAGTDTPVATYYLAANTNFDIQIPAGLYFSTGIGYALTTAAADSDTSALTAGDVVCMNISYQ